MATLVLSTAGQTLGRAFGGNIGAQLGRTVGAFAGNYVDQLLFGEDTENFGPRLDDLSVQASREGAPIPKIYGRARLAGQMIWATNFREVANRNNRSSKAQPRGQNSVTFSYFANFAIALCEGEINTISKIWADGKPIDQSLYTIRIYNGRADQPADSLIEAIQGAGQTPAYRGIAYVVFEHFPLEAYGNRIPNISFEVLRVVETLESKISAVAIIPGATEFGYLPRAITRDLGLGEEAPENQHLTGTASDWTASLDELQSLCPNLKGAALVVSWFGTDLRAGECQILPGVEERNRPVNGANWSVGSFNRSNAHLVSRLKDRPAFGGTPSDISVVEAIADLKARGLNVCFYPFILMDVPANNALPDPYGSSEQAVFPWRGRITCHPAPYHPGSTNGTASAKAQVDAWIGDAQSNYRAMIRHYAKLVESAGGVDTFLIGSELRGLTQIRDENDAFPFVEKLVDLAREVRTIVSSETQISYAADWSEYFGHHASDGSGDVFFNLDSLWANDAIDFVGIDNYFPLSDWRDENNHDGKIWPSLYDQDYLQSNIEGGEYYDWYYASDKDRQSGERTPITDGAYNKPWVFRTKDLKNWWLNPHHPRISGIEQPVESEWIPQSKPFRFIEFGCPAVDRGPNQPNVFPDSVSSEGTIPYHSNGARDDLIQRRYLEATLDYWTGTDSADRNPISARYQAPMVEHDDMFIWSWDARPFPVFPYATDIWSDGVNWSTGHWINGRLGGLSLTALVKTILDDYEIGNYEICELEGAVTGFSITSPMSAKSALSTLLATFSIDVIDAGTKIRFLKAARGQSFTIDQENLVEREAENTLVLRKRAQETELPSEIRVSYQDIGREYEAAIARSRRLAGNSHRVETLNLAVTGANEVLQSAAEARLQHRWLAREGFQFTLPPSLLAIEVGDIIAMSEDAKTNMRIEKQSTGYGQRVEARSHDEKLFRRIYLPPAKGKSKVAKPSAKPLIKIMDLPTGDGSNDGLGLRVATFAKPWLGDLSVLRSASGAHFNPISVISSPAVMGTLQNDFEPGPLWRWDRSNNPIVKLQSGTLVTQSDLDVLAGENLAAIEMKDGSWEVIQFAEATLIAANTYQIRKILRAQAGTEDAMQKGASVGAAFVLLDQGIADLPADLDIIGLNYHYQFVPTNAGLSDPKSAAVEHRTSGRALLPFAPVHFTAMRDPLTDNVQFSWIRRNRRNADSWEIPEIPMSEESEMYQVSLLNNGDIVRQTTASQPSWVYTRDDQMSDFATLPSTLTAEVSQLSAEIGAGVASSKVFSF